MPGNRSADCVVIGGGLMGVAVAYWLARRGCDVELLESYCLAAGSSGRNAGLLLHGASPIEDPQLLDDVRREEGLDFDYTQPGHLSLASSLSVWEQFQEEVERRPASAPPLEALDRRACEDLLHTRIHDAYPGGRWYRAGAVAHSARFVCELAGAAIRHRARIHTGTPVTRITESADRVSVHTASGRVTAKAVVHATAAAACALLPELASVLTAIRVQVMATDPMPALFAVGLGVNWGDVFGRQLPDGRFVLGGGGGARLANLDAADVVDQPVQDTLRTFLRRTFPECPPFTVASTWAGVLDCTPDGRPLVGAHPWRHGQWLCAGFNGHGMPAALGVGRALAAAVETGEVPATLRAWAPARFEAACV